MKIFVAMSGGVDSSVAALLLKRSGQEVVGIHIRTGVSGPEASPGGRPRCCGADEADDARRTAALLGIPFFVQNAEGEFRGIIEAFAGAYARGETPNPCIACNRKVKFGAMLARARALGADAVATGHYARVVDSGGRPALARARDRSKDQSYVLYGLEPKALRLCRFPLGELSKEEVRAIAREAGLPAADKPESQEICFVPSGDYRDLVRRERPEAFEPGPIRDEAGRTIGTHPGVGSFTVGQRRGLGIASAEPLFVIGIDPSARAVTVGPAESLGVRRVRLAETVFTAMEPPDEPVAVEAMLRYRARPLPAMVRCAGSGEALLEFDSPAWPVTPGQAAVFYRGDLVLGGGTIRAGS